MRALTPSSQNNPALSTPLEYLTTGALRTRWTVLVSRFEWLWPKVKTVCSGCLVFSYDHTIEAPAERGKSVRFFKTGHGFGDYLEPITEILKKNHISGSFSGVYSLR